MGSLVDLKIYPFLQGWTNLMIFLDNLMNQIELTFTREEVERICASSKMDKFVVNFLGNESN